MLQSLNVKNFKAWSDLNIGFGPITGLFGTNSSGKSSIIQFLLLLKQTREATDRTTSLDLNDQYVNLGNFNDIIFSHDEKNELSWELSFSLPEPLSLFSATQRRTRPFIRARELTVSGAVGSGPSGPASRRLSYRLGTDPTFSLSQKKEDSAAFDLRSNGTDFRFIRNSGRAWQIPGPIKSYAYPDQARTYFQNASFLSDLEVAYERQMDDIYYLGPLREHPKREYTWARSRPRDVGIRGEKVIDALLSATVTKERRNLKPKTRLWSFQEMVAHWLKELGLIHDFQVTELAKGSNYWQAKVVVREGGSTALLTDVGFGISQVLPIITLLYFVPEGSTVILEQPEIHLHPLAQANLADLIINVSQNRNVQVIFESHSEHLLLRLQRRIAEEKILSSDVSLYFCDTNKNKSKLSRLEIDEYGQISNWPENFMGDAFGETVAAERARLKRMKSKA
ncbi:DUF3696 domain-containing protein [Hansschlegelia plantiphila]|uniref:DUF3696 domain-containing protein n=1 Tax=Hansschlegelia plantiphila TaxID=374655 RepID=A0A9W6MV78_9HYPH|nr:DUF3696 domain-containing protein [Hansschlegelia plantiphila]GLK67663.1 hypothetical protein GCM10008179_13010 [Hansschlegelia plantiphila]